MWNKINVLLICGLTFLLLSCKENPPTSLTGNSTQSKSPEGSITFISLAKSSNSLQKDIIIYDTKLITAKSGGTLQVYFEYQGTNGKVAVTATLNIPGGAVAYDQYLMMAFDEQALSGSVDFTFGPHGTTFLTPALLNIDAKGLDLSSLPPNAKLQLYYFDPVSYTYAPMNTRSTNYSLQSGWIKCQDGQLPHFSRYAFGYVN
jgi:hypothetical protein